jgi:hypothetical protein
MSIRCSEPRPPKQFISFHQFGHPAGPPVSSWDKIGGQTSENPERKVIFHMGE